MGIYSDGWIFRILLQHQIKNILSAAKAIIVAQANPIGPQIFRNTIPRQRCTAISTMEE